MASYSGIYIMRLDNTSINHARALVQLNAPSTKTLEIIRAWCSFSATTSVATEVGLKRITTAGTPGATPTPILLRPGDVAAGATCGTNYSADGTLGDILPREFVNQQGNWLYLPVPEERIIVAPSGRIALYLPTAPTAVTLTCGIVWGEIG